MEFILVAMIIIGSAIGYYGAIKDHDKKLEKEKTEQVEQKNNSTSN